MWLSAVFAVHFAIAVMLLGAVVWLTYRIEYPARTGIVAGELRELASNLRIATAGLGGVWLVCAIRLLRGNGWARVVLAVLSSLFLLPALLFLRGAMANGLTLGRLAVLIAIVVCLAGPLVVLFLPQVAEEMRGVRRTESTSLKLG